MPQKRRTSGRSHPKIFRCTGFGECSMVFTRSEHLARHERKHTGEKPYQCIITGCQRMFSRYDNMIQHTQTHGKSKRKSEGTDNSMPIEKEDVLINNTSQLQPNNYNTDTRNKQRTRRVFPEETSYQVRNQLPPMGDRTLPLPTPLSAQGFPQYPESQDFHLFNNYSFNDLSSVDTDYQKKYPTQYQDRSPTTDEWRYGRYYPRYSRDNSLSSSSSDNDTYIIKRRISVEDLYTPIEKLLDIKVENKIDRSFIDSDRSDNTSKDTVDMTEDEYEALQGLSKFRSDSTVSDSNSLVDDEMSNQQFNSPNLSSRLCGLRQSIPTTKISHQRFYPLLKTEVA
ncbi:hypothetical protein BDB01DRAFT_771436 [Pilobolus umbonatus]|nr:hypothetical protein BDB01DRAFT_771436 [Pilobolus umbonatus]